MSFKSIDLIWITVDNIEDSIRYYTENLGFKLTSQSPEWGWAELETKEKGTILALSQYNPNFSQFKPGQNGIITLTVANLHQEIERLKKKGEVILVGEMMEVPGHVKIQTIQDQSGNTLQLCEKISV